MYMWIAFSSTQDPVCLEVKKELESAEAASKISFVTINAELAEIKKGLATIAKYSLET